MNLSLRRFGFKYNPKDFGIDFPHAKADPNGKLVYQYLAPNVIHVPGYNPSKWLGSISLSEFF